MDLQGHTSSWHGIILAEVFGWGIMLASLVVFSHVLFLFITSWLHI
jgi:hypothetical protein